MRAFLFCCLGCVVAHASLWAGNQLSRNQPSSVSASTPSDDTAFAASTDTSSAVGGASAAASDGTYPEIDACRERAAQAGCPLTTIGSPAVYPPQPFWLRDAHRFAADGAPRILPIDIWFEMLGHLTPEELKGVSEVSRGFFWLVRHYRDTHSKRMKAVTCWKLPPVLLRPCPPCEKVVLKTLPFGRCDMDRLVDWLPVGVRLDVRGMVASVSRLTTLLAYLKEKGKSPSHLILPAGLPLVEESLVAMTPADRASAQCLLWRELACTLGDTQVLLDPQNCLRPAPFVSFQKLTTLLEHLPPNTLQHCTVRTQTFGTLGPAMRQQQALQTFILEPSSTPIGASLDLRVFSFGHLQHLELDDRFRLTPEGVAAIGQLRLQTLGVGIRFIENASMETCPPAFWQALQTLKLRFSGNTVLRPDNRVWHFLDQVSNLTTFWLGGCVLPPPSLPRLTNALQGMHELKALVHFDTQLTRGDTVSEADIRALWNTLRALPLTHMHWQDTPWFPLFCTCEAQEQELASALGSAQLRKLVCSRIMRHHPLFSSTPVVQKLLKRCTGLTTLGLYGLSNLHLLAPCVQQMPALSLLKLDLIQVFGASARAAAHKPKSWRPFFEALPSLTALETLSLTGIPMDEVNLRSLTSVLATNRLIVCDIICRPPIRVLTERHPLFQGFAHVTRLQRFSVVHAGVRPQDVTALLDTHMDHLPHLTRLHLEEKQPWNFATTRACVRAAARSTVLNFLLKPTTTAFTAEQEAELRRIQAEAWLHPHAGQCAASASAF